MMNDIAVSIAIIAEDQEAIISRSSRHGQLSAAAHATASGGGGNSRKGKNNGSRLARNSRREKKQRIETRCLLRFLQLVRQPRGRLKTTDRDSRATG